VNVFDNFICGLNDGINIFVCLIFWNRGPKIWTCKSFIWM